MGYALWMLGSGAVLSSSQQRDTTSLIRLDGLCSPLGSCAKGTSPALVSGGGLSDPGQIRVPRVMSDIIGQASCCLPQPEQY
jgi:hypothetical protein